MLPKHASVAKFLTVDVNGQLRADGVVERDGRRVRVLRLPVHPFSPCVFGCSVNLLDQRSTDAAAARGLCGEQILEVADRTDRAGIAVEYEVRQPEQ